MTIDEAHEAVEHEDLQRLSAALAQGASVDSRDDQGWTLLHHAIDAERDSAAQTGEPLRASVTQFLLEHGAGIELEYEGQTALELAESLGHHLAASAIRHIATQPSTSWRPLGTNEAQILLAITSQDFAGSQALRAQIQFTEFSPGCKCGCGTINLRVDRERSQPAHPTRNPVPGEARFHDEVGLPGGILILFARDGYLSCLEVVNWGDPLPMPNAANVDPYIAEPAAVDQPQRKSWRRPWTRG